MPWHWCTSSKTAKRSTPSMWAPAQRTATHPTRCGSAGSRTAPREPFAPGLRCTFNRLSAPAGLSVWGHYASRIVRGRVARFLSQDRKGPVRNACQQGGATSTRAALMSPSPTKIGSAFMPCTCTGTPSGQAEPNSETGTQLPPTHHSREQLLLTNAHHHRDGKDLPEPPRNQGRDT